MERQHRPWIELACRVDHHRVRELACCLRKQRQRESELAARADSGQQRQSAARQASDPGQAIKRRPAQPGQRGRKLRHPRERLAPEADPNRFDRVIESLGLAAEITRACLYLHLSLVLPPGLTQGWRGGLLKDYRTDVRESREKRWKPLARDMATSWPPRPSRAPMAPAPSTGPS